MLIQAHPRISQLDSRFAANDNLTTQVTVAFAVNLALDELIRNVILYAYPGREHGIDMQLRLEPGVLRITWSTTAAPSARGRRRRRASTR